MIYKGMNRRIQELESTLVELRNAHAWHNERIEKERSDVAQFLHGEVQQHFGAILRDFSSRLPAPEHELFIERMLNGLDLVDTLINKLHPPILLHLGLIPALEQYIAELNQTRGLNIQFNYIAVSGLSKKKHIILYRTVQMGLSMLLKQEGIGDIEVSVSKPTPELLRIQINGNKSHGNDCFATESNNLTFMRESLNKIHAKLYVHSNDQETIICKLPL